VSSFLINFLKQNKNQKVKIIGSFFILLCLGWYTTSTIYNYPYYISYFNEIVGIDNGYKYVVDSNYDWGQDLKRLEEWIKTNEVQEIKVDYFGGADLNYYIPQATQLNPFGGKQKGYIAISTTLRQSGIGEPLPGFNYNPGYYRWLEEYKPIARAGKSILIYHIK
jgi:hypothetical protein